MSRIARFRLHIVTLIMVVSVSTISCNQVDHTERIEQHKKLAGELHANRLFPSAIDEYKKALKYDDLDDGRRANINYLIARIYFKDLKEYEQAAAYYLRAREYDSEGSFMNEASKNLVASLEKLGNVLDAKRQLSSATDIDSGPATDDDVAVARISNRTVWLSEIDNHIAALPRDVQKQFLDRKAKVDLVRQYVGVELLYAAAVREDYLSDPEIQQQEEMLLKRLLVDRFVADKVMPQAPVDTMDLRNYYEANKETMYKGAPFDSVGGRVYLDYQTTKAESAYNDYISKLAAVEKVEFLDHNVK